MKTTTFRIRLLFGGFLFLFAAVWNLRLFLSTFKTRRSTNRLAILLPYTTGRDDTTGGKLMPPYMNVFCLGAAGIQDVADVFVFYTDNDMNEQQYDCPPNVKFINLQSHDNLASYLVKVVAYPPPALKSFLGKYIAANPYALVEFKPALGYMFQEFLADYSHWGYADFDMVFGDLSKFITDDEWNDFDIVTYTFGDQERLYLRGQFTFHKNTPTVNELWKSCDYLTHMDDRFEQLVEQQSKYRVESAEGCYSHAVMNRNDIAVKFANKAWTDIYKSDAAYSHGIFVSRTHKKQVIYKSTHTNVTHLPYNWFEKESSYRKSIMQKEVGERQLVPLTANPKAKCLYWVLQKYQSKLCLDTHVGRDETVFWINGKLYKQRFETAQLPVYTAPFFHFQEWKRTYRPEQLANMHWSSPIRTFVLTEQGSLPLIPTTKIPKAIGSSPLGWTSLKHWRSSEQILLNNQTYCLSWKGEQHVRCANTTQWKDAEIIVSAPTWTNVRPEYDVSLLLTLQVDAENLKWIMDHLLLNLQRWQGQPSVVLISVSGDSGVSNDITTAIRQTLHSEGHPDVLQSSLIAVLYSEKVASRKALMNMVVDVSPTRWYVTGLELERGLMLSTDAVFLSLRAAEANSKQSGSVLVLPQFGLVENVGSLKELLEARKFRNLQDLSFFETSCEDKHEDILGVNQLWWQETSLLLNATAHQLDLSTWATKLEEMEHAIIGSSGAIPDSPVLLIDNLGPGNGILTHKIVREVEANMGVCCYNGLKQTQLGIMGYHFNVLGGAFVYSTEKSRRRSNRCDSTCLDESFSEKELQRVAKTAILWSETFNT